MQDSKLIIGISSRALFDLDESHEIYKKHGLKFKIQYLGMYKELFYKYLLIFKPKKTENIPTKMLENT